MTALALAGIRVIDMTTFFAGCAPARPAQELRTSTATNTPIKHLYDVMLCNSVDPLIRVSAPATRQRGTRETVGALPL